MYVILYDKCTSDIDTQRKKIIKKNISTKYCNLFWNIRWLVMTREKKIVFTSDSTWVMTDCV